MTATTLTCSASDSSVRTGWWPGWVAKGVREQLGGIRLFCASVAQCAHLVANCGDHEYDRHNMATPTVKATPIWGQPSEP
jgi:hypothetical protein